MATTSNTTTKNINTLTNMTISMNNMCKKGKRGRGERQGDDDGNAVHILMFKVKVLRLL